MDAVEKEGMRQLAMRGPPFSPDESLALLAYCEQDVVMTYKVLRAMIPYIPNALFALQRGRYLCSFARSQHHGIPLDVELVMQLRDKREVIIERIIESVNPEFGVYRGTEFKYSAMEDLITKHRLPWPRCPSGCLSMSGETWEEMTERFPFLEPLQRCKQLVNRLRENRLGVGKDGRSRPRIFPFTASTGRSTWASSGYIFALMSYLRGLIRPPPGRALGYLDYKSQEIWVAAVLSNDSALMAAYESQDIYFAFGIAAGLIPPNATEESHSVERKWLKQCVLGMSYDITKYGLSRQLDLQLDRAEALISAHRRTYSSLARWKEAVINQALLDRFQETVLGWRTEVRFGQVIRNGKKISLFNPRSTVNFPVQGCAGDVTRTSACLISEAGTDLLTSVHDAHLIEADEDKIDAKVDSSKQLMTEAGYQLLGSASLRVEAKIIRHPHRLLTDEKDKEKWRWLMGQLTQKKAVSN
jgi:hypothetical protein